MNFSTLRVLCTPSRSSTTTCLSSRLGVRNYCFTYVDLKGLGVGRTLHGYRLLTNDAPSRTVEAISVSFCPGCAGPSRRGPRAPRRPRGGAGRRGGGHPA